jgi:toxin FitB
MVKALLDTCVLTELWHPDGHRGVRSAVEDMGEETIFLSVLTVGEMAKGIALLAAGKKKKAIAAWLAEFEAEHADRILPIDIETARLWGDVTARCQKIGVTIPPTDGLIAATALQHGLPVMTRNTRDFAHTGVKVVNPWDEPTPPK